MSHVRKPMGVHTLLVLDIASELLSRTKITATAS